MNKQMCWIAVAAMGAALAGCGSEEGTGSAAFTTWGEEYIEEGIPADVFEDGWSIKYTRFLVVISDIWIADKGGEQGARMSGSKLFNHVVPGTKEVAAFDGLDARSWNYVSYQVSVAKADTELSEGATEADKALMVDGGYNVYVEGEAMKGPDTRSFAWGFSEPTLLDRCKGDRDGKEVEGLLVTNGGTESVELTIHGDHLFYDDLQGGNAKVRFNAIASADTDTDGVIAMEELDAVKLVDIEAGTYGTGSAADINTLGQFVASLSRTVGHYRGEGECVVKSP